MRENPYSQITLSYMCIVMRHPGSSFMVAAALGDRKADTVLVNCRLVSVYTGEIISNTQISISDSRISYVGTDASHTIGPHTRVIDAKGRYVAPGLADPHTHIDQFLLPNHTASTLLAHGTTSIFSDPIDITGTLGYRGLEWFVDACRDQLVRIFHGIPGGQPVDPVLSNSCRLSPEEQAKLLQDDTIFGMGEVFAWTKVTGSDPQTLESLDQMRRAHAIVNGHTAGMRGVKLGAYAASGIASCHEPIDYSQTLERLRLGLHVMIREGSIRRDLQDIMQEILSKDIYTGRIMFCSDGLNPNDILHGHINCCIRKAIRVGVDAVDAIRMATANVFGYYNMDSDLGGISPGRLADIILLDDLASFKINTILRDGTIVVSDGRIQGVTQDVAVPSWLYTSTTVSHAKPADFDVMCSKDTARVNTIRLLTEIITAPGTAQVPVVDSRVSLPDGDLWRVAAFERVTRSNLRTVGFLEGFGVGQGAVASTYTFHENDLIVIGRDKNDMAIALNRVNAEGGGTVVVQNGRPTAVMPLSVAGIMSDDTPDKVRDQFIQVNEAMYDMGCVFDQPQLIPLFLPFLALPKIRILSSGIVNVLNQETMPPVIRE